MKNLDKKLTAFAVALSFLAGFVDAVGYVYLGGLFVSFMSGNSTLLAVDLATHYSAALAPFGIILMFVVGVTAGALLAHYAGKRRAPLLLLFVAALLAIGAALDLGGYAVATIACMALAMGAENNIFSRDGEVSVGVTYMTGALVKMGQRFATALTGGEKMAWLPHALLWLGLVFGAATGAIVYSHLQLSSLWVASALSLLLAFIALKLSRAGKI